MSDSTTINLAVMIDEMEIGGAQRQIQGMLARLPDHIRPHIICLEREGNIGRILRESGVPVCEFGMKNLWSLHGLQAVRKIKSQLKDWRIKVLHSWLGTSNLIAAKIGRQAGVKVITSRRDTGFWMGARFRWCARMVANYADLVLANSSIVRGAAIVQEGVSPKLIEVIHNATDIPEFLSLPERERVRAELGCGEREVIIIQVATLTAVKEHRTALAAIRLLKDEGFLFRWVFVGGGLERDSLYRKAEELGVFPEAVFVGSREDVRSLLLAADISVLTSSSEGFPNAVLESMAAGLPVVSTACGGVNDMLTHGIEGLLVPVGDAPGLAQSAGRLIFDTELRVSMGERGRYRAKREFSWERLMERMVGIYERLAADKGGD